ncbi:unnamed protein product [Caenorhabditis auriculariae]|uniref:Peptidase S1 domain-containing protein n=1 Tax=Caenorhabditis auriculariae TaxID=2777116 RepID=A0A8S1GZP3_9PELO|nr:unnamed protein product [Caenorhabditis auriculariae]
MSFMKGFLIIFVCTSILDCKRLSRKENDYLQSVCGKINTEPDLKRKILNGVYVKPGEAPWAVGLRIDHEEGPDEYCSGTLISSRHFLTARHCIVKRFDVSRCEKGIYHLDPAFFKVIEVFIGTTCLGKKHCEKYNQKLTGVTRRIISAYMIEYCEEPSANKLRTDLAVVEVDKDVKFDSSIYPVCLAPLQTEELKKINAKLPRALFGFGHDPSMGRYSEDQDFTLGALRREDVYPSVCEPLDIDYRFMLCTTSISGNALGCGGDSGCGVIQYKKDEQNNPRVTVEGVLVKGVACRANLKDASDWSTPVGNFSSRICQASGVCIQDFSNGDFDYGPPVVELVQSEIPLVVKSGLEDSLSNGSSEAPPGQLFTADVSKPTNDLEEKYAEYYNVAKEKLSYIVLLIFFFQIIFL